MIDSKQVSFNNDTSVYAMPIKYASSLNVAPRSFNERNVKKNSESVSSNMFTVPKTNDANENHSFGQYACSQSETTHELDLSYK